MDRLSPLDAMFLGEDTPNEPRQIASLVVLEPDGSPLTFDGLVQVLNERLDIVPRYRQVPYKVPAGLGTPIWRDFPRFDISQHVRGSALPKPGGRAELHELVGRLVARRLELDRPLWELYYIEGLANGAEALLFKAHQALVDGSETIDLAQVLLEETAHVRDIPHHEWEARPEPSGVTLIWITRSYRPFRTGQKWLITVGDPERLIWYARGRLATRAEVDESIASGLPLLMDVAVKQDAEEPGAGAVAALTRVARALERDHYPAAPPPTSTSRTPTTGELTT
jgi:diacylglycerol O-acyltransferase